MEINFNNPDFDAILQKAGFIRKEEGSTIFINGGVTIDLGKGMSTVNIRKIVDCSFKNGACDDKAKQTREQFLDFKEWERDKCGLPWDASPKEIIEQYFKHR